ncbi:MAG: SUMF1/EgtB/PvdO family nonheme iron enzyme [Magnetovibrionaceae bacterium]
MNPIEQNLARARRRHRFGLLLTGLLVGGAGLLFAIWLFAASATQIVVEPPEAAALAQMEVTSGLAFLSDGTVFRLGSRHDVQVTAKGFRPAVVALSGDSAAGPVRVVMVPLPARLIADTGSAALEDVRWYLDDRLVHMGGTLDTEREAGPVLLRAEHPHYLTGEAEIVLERGGEHRETLSLAPVPGTLQLTSEPEGARVSVQGDDLGVTPISIPLFGGAYDIAVDLPDHAPVTERVDVTLERPVVVRNYRLEPLNAFIDITLSPAGGVLTVNGRIMQQPEGPIPVAANQAVVLTYGKSGFSTDRQSLVLQPNETRSVSLRLGTQWGEVLVRSEPPGDVKIDGQSKGQTPLDLKLRTRPHKVEVTRPGYRAFQGRVTPEVGSPKLIEARLMTEKAASLAEAKTAYTHSSGIEFKLFQPDRIVLGVPRGEAGRRANEFIRNVRLVRPFYAALHEVTNQQFRAFDPERGAGPADQPVVNVDWQRAAAFCNWLSEREGREAFYILDRGRVSGFRPQSTGYRLLTEAEWEWLARKAGRKSQTLFPWGAESVIPSRFGNVGDESAKASLSAHVPRYTDGFDALAPVGSFEAEASGLYDLFGNVSEWVHDAYSLRPPRGGEETDPMGPAIGDSYVVKGANWRSASLTELRPAFRQGQISGRDDIGFRVGRYLYGEERQDQ